MSAATASAGRTGSSIPEVEETLARIRSHRGVEGIIIMSSEGAIIQSTLSEEQTTAHAALLSQLAAKAANLVETLDAGDELTFLRIKSKNREIMVSPDKEYLLVVIQNPHATE
uniref:Dynein light chain roadblock n=1 Tax=Trieres chinensis TaxID=1514140 RepID=A0A7S2EHJ0_TRICV|mmetsp:Transcript_23151/g.46966  ORF Transcript_23151/g.46966 Transcript_23151/m.46966 type:complete len:113 (+) Transcript_23151:79-417(+)|eukprot:CAMPEP_0183307344 /NCGR_PEP_ID=MMETSP0160_2-20130417/17276_1 /TAXON_ID=2839 ORGANISM="Odontella Sinensis, Strain Grunow 1884" /NCGR_SAMPLE_ID=MMETSP0160_2 /ASSEMBLY_ACC=CAM_ASM_000250 /LENGTH=112 /DNA_ID=CAMNT_0025470911 /DNA_START=72 /DNA_END=410 /DNA_ORIENTATION=+